MNVPRPAAQTSPLPKYTSQRATEVPFLGGTLLIDLAPRRGKKTAMLGGIPPGTMTAAAGGGRILRSTAVAGSAVLDVPVPDDVSLVGEVFYTQSIAQDPSQPSGWALSNGVRIVVSAP